MADAPTVIDLFSGCGGFSLGFQSAGCRLLAAVDFDEAAGDTYRHNFEAFQPSEPPLVFSGEAGNLEEVDLALVASHGRPDIVIGGPPCQGFSRVGRGKLNDLFDEGFAADARNTLYQRFVDAIREWQPAALVMENVPGMLSIEGRNMADQAASDLGGCGYRVGYAVLNSAWYGVPQFRERLFFVGLRRDLGLLPLMPTATHRVHLPSGYIRAATDDYLPFEDIHHELSVPLSGASNAAVTAREALDDLPVLMDHLDGTPPARGDFRIPRSYRAKARSGFARLMRNWPGLPRSTSVVDQAIRRTPRDYETFRRMKPGDRYVEARRIARERFGEYLKSLGAQAPPTASLDYTELERRFVPPYPEEIFRDKWRKLIPAQPSWTVPAHLAKDAYSHIHYDSDQARTISVREAARLQSFPDSYAFDGNMGECFRQIGNAVPPLLAWAVAAQVLKQLGKEARLPMLSSAKD